MLFFRSTLRLIIVTTILLAGGIAGPSRPASAANSLAAAAPEVRLRKLHLARPDLILYPISYEFVC
jgi:hypothetical protein